MLEDVFSKVEGNSGREELSKENEGREIGGKFTITIRR
jgi:hypothetical protein